MGSAQPACCPSGTVEAIAPWVTWLLVLIGWYVLHRTAVSRARRQENLAATDAICARVTALRDKAVEYYTGESTGSGARVQEAQIKHEIKSLQAAIRVLKTRRPTFFDLDSEMILFRQACTGGEFESRGRANVSHDDPIVCQLWLAADTLVCALHDEFEKAHKW